MSGTYVAINGIFLTPLLVAAVLRRKQLDGKRILWTLAILCTLTAVFDNLIIAAGIVAYNPQAISSIKIGLAPIEDFTYTVAATLLVALFWKAEK